MKRIKRDEGFLKEMIEECIEKHHRMLDLFLAAVVCDEAYTREEIEANIKELILFEEMTPLGYKYSIGFDRPKIIKEDFQLHLNIFKEHIIIFKKSLEPDQNRHDSYLKLSELLNSFFNVCEQFIERTKGLR